ncbi:MAG: MBL fold metallo-hydrolase [Bacillota bacterium]|nr:MBL fold metallo-hydrolase [Bacillota bacterium]
MKIEKIEGNTFCIDTGITYIPFYKINEQEIIMLDSGWAKIERRGIDELLERNSFKVVAIICSHAHQDHIGNNAYLKNKYNCIIAMPIYEALICSSTTNLKLYYSSETLSEVTENFGHLVCQTDMMILHKQDSINVCGIEFRIFHTPGHSPEHICITTPDDVAYLGDALISYEIMKASKMPYSYILREDLESKTKLYELNFCKYIVAHKGIYSDIRELITDNINFYKHIAKKIYTLIDDDMTLQDILKTVAKSFNININSKNRYTLIERMLKSYVEYLHETGLLQLEVEDGVLKYSEIKVMEEL